MTIPVGRTRAELAAQARAAFLGRRVRLRQAGRAYEGHVRSVSAAGVVLVEVPALPTPVNVQAYEALSTLVVVMSV